MELELNEQFGMSVSTTTIWRALAEMGYSWKKVKIHCSILRPCLMFRKVDRRAIEQNEDVRDAYRFHMSFEYHPEQLVFVDESSCDRRLARQYGRAMKGRRVTRKTVFFHGRRYLTCYILLDDFYIPFLGILCCLQYCSMRYSTSG